MRSLWCTLGLCVLLVAAAPAGATIVSGTYTFSVPNSGPINPFTASFSITFDNTADIGDTTTGITLLTEPAGFTLGSPLGFAYSAAPSDSLVVGGTALGVGGLGDGGPHDFLLTIEHASSGAPTLRFFVYFSGEIGTTPFAESGTVTFTPGPVPEPGTLALLTSALLFAGAARSLRRRRYCVGDNA